MARNFDQIAVDNNFAGFFQRVQGAVEKAQVASFWDPPLEFFLADPFFQGVFPDVVFQPGNQQVFDGFEGFIG